MAAVPQTQTEASPLHDPIAFLLDPEYVKFYNKHLLYAPQVQNQPVAASRVGGRLIPGGTEPVSVGQTIDIRISRKETSGPDVPVRVFVPPGPPPSEGWPVLLWYHGGGWVLGNIDSENSLCTNLCHHASCVVVTTDYRLAPENPFPAAVHDAWETVLWTVSDRAGTDTGLAIDYSKICIGGSSAGGNLAAVMTQKALVHEALRAWSGFRFQLLVVPVTDNTLDQDSSPTYKSYEYTPALPVAKMLWYRNHYLQKKEDRFLVEASPLRATAETLSQLPPALVVVAGLDILRWEGEEYAKQLARNDVVVETVVIEAVPHPFIVMDGVLRKGRDGVALLCEKLKSALE